MHPMCYKGNTIFIFFLNVFFRAVYYEDDLTQAWQQFQSHFQTHIKACEQFQTHFQAHIQETEKISEGQEKDQQLIDQSDHSTEQEEKLLNEHGKTNSTTSKSDQRSTPSTDACGTIDENSADAASATDEEENGCGVHAEHPNGAIAIEFQDTNIPVSTGAIPMSNDQRELQDTPNSMPDQKDAIQPKEHDQISNDAVTPAQNLSSLQPGAETTTSLDTCEYVTMETSMTAVPNSAVSPETTSSARNDTDNPAHSGIHEDASIVNGVNELQINGISTSEQKDLHFTSQLVAY